MDEHISRDKAEKIIADVINRGGTVAEILTEIHYLPAADVVEVRHGHWIEQPPDFDLCGVAYYQCSECKQEQQTPSNYCEFCGARMDGGQDDV